jgi:ribosomal protein S18 acetylase RimI-like enzyme
MKSYRWMTEADVDALGALARRIWNAHYIHFISQSQIDYMLEKSYSPESLTRQLASGHQFLLALVNEAMVGFVSVGSLRDIENLILRGDNADTQSYFLHKFYIAEEHRGTGMGKALLAELLSRQPNIRRLRLQVARKNVNSWNFYLTQGFTIEQEADFDIGNGFVMADYVMQKIVL